MRQSAFIQSTSLKLMCFLPLALAGCAKVAVTPGSIRPPDPSLAYNAIEAEPTVPTQIVVNDFDFVPSSVSENRSPIHRGIDLVRRVRRMSVGSQSVVMLRQACRSKPRSGYAGRALQ